jgi:hypothetical protein
VALHEAGEKNALATALMEHASAAVNLATAMYVTKQHEGAEAAYEKALQVGDGAAA